MPSSRPSRSRRPAPTRSRSATPTATLGLYSIQAYLNSYVKQGTSNVIDRDGQDLTQQLVPARSRQRRSAGAWWAACRPTSLTAGDVFVSSRFYGFYFSAPTISDILRVNDAGPDRAGHPGQRSTRTSRSRGVRARSRQQHAVRGRDDQLQRFRRTWLARSTASCSSSTRSPGSRWPRSRCRTIPSNFFWYYPYGFSIASDGTFWIPQPNSENIIHLDASDNEIASYSTGGYGARERVDRDRWQRLLLRAQWPSGNGIYQLNPTSGAVNFFAFTARPPDHHHARRRVAPASGSAISTLRCPPLRLQRQPPAAVGFFGTNQAQNDQHGNVWTPTFNYWDLFQFDQFGNCPARDFRAGCPSA